MKKLLILLLTILLVTSAQAAPLVGPPNGFQNPGEVTLGSLTVTNNLAVGGVIVPQEQVITIPVTKAMISGGEVNTSVFIASDAWTITHVEEVHSVAESTATTLTVTLMKLTGTQAPSAGTNVTESEFSLKAAADTVQVGAVSTTAGVATLADGDRLGLLCAMTGVADAAEFRGGTITVHMKRV